MYATPYELNSVFAGQVTNADALFVALRLAGTAYIPRDTVVRLNKTLLICEKKPSRATEEKYHCECRRLCPSPREKVRGRRLRGGRRREG